MIYFVKDLADGYTKNTSTQGNDIKSTLRRYICFYINIHIDVLGISYFRLLYIDSSFILHQILLLSLSR